jgi:hypothetical protein
MGQAAKALALSPRRRYAHEVAPVVSRARLAVEEDHRLRRVGLASLENRGFEAERLGPAGADLSLTAGFRGRTCMLEKQLLSF